MDVKKNKKTKEKDLFVYMISGFAVFMEYGEEHNLEVSISFVSDKNISEGKIKKAMTLFKDKAKGLVREKNFGDGNFILKRVVLYKRLNFLSIPSFLDYLIDKNYDFIS